MYRELCALLLILGHSLSVSISPGHPALGKLNPSYNSWAITVSINTSPFRDQLSATEKQASELQNLIPFILEQANKTGRSGLEVLTEKTTRFDDFLNNLQLEVTYLYSAFPEILSGQVSHRQRRGLINGLGDAMSYLFGTATEGEIHHLQSQISILGKEDKILAHSFNGTLTKPR